MKKLLLVGAAALVLTAFLPDEASAAPVCVVGSSGPAASRSGQDLPHALLISIGSVIAASPSRRCHSPSALVSMAARAGHGNRRRGAGSGSGPVTTTMGTTDTT